MVETKTVRMPVDLYELLKERARETFGLDRQEWAFLALLLQGNPATSATNSVAAPENQKKRRLNNKGKKLLVWEPVNQGTLWEYGKKEIDELFSIYEAIGEHAVDLGMSLLFPEEEEVPDDGRLVEKANELYKLKHEYGRQWRKGR